MPNTFVEKTVKALIKEYGFQMEFQILVTASANFFTGEHNHTLSPRSTVKALILNQKVTERFSYDLTYIAAGKNFVYGGMYDDEELPVACLTRDLPEGYSNSSRVIFNDTQYQIRNHYNNPLGVTGFNLLSVKGQNEL